MRAMVDRYVAEGTAPSIVVAVGGRRGPPVFFSAGEVERGTDRPVGPDTLYGLNSMTKPIVGFAIMALVEDGTLTLDTPVAAIFPAFAQLRVLTDGENGLASRPAGRPMTVRHLITHTSGLAYDFNTTGDLQRLYSADPLAIWQRVQPDGTSKGPGTHEAYANAVATLPLMFEPGTAWKYSIGLDVAVSVVEKVTGLPIETFFAKRLFGPLRMTDTFYTVPAAKLDRLSAAYRPGAGGLELVETARSSAYRLPTRTPPGGGGLVSSARDYARFLKMLLLEGQLDGVRVLGTRTARMMMSNLMEAGVTAHTSYGDSGYGAGGRVAITSTTVGEAPGTYGWTGSSNTMAWVDRANGTYVVFMTQIRQWYPNPIFDDFVGAHYADLHHA